MPSVVRDQQPADKPHLPAACVDWAELPTSLLELLFAEVARGKGCSGHTAGFPLVEKTCSSKVRHGAPCASCYPRLPFWQAIIVLVWVRDTHHSAMMLQEILQLTSVCRSWRQACQMSLYHPGHPWSSPMDYVHPMQLFTRVRVCAQLPVSNHTVLHTLHLRANALH